MKKLFTFSIISLSFFLCQTVQAQFKIHSNGRITFQSTLNSASQGVVIDPYPSCSTTINGDAHFSKLAVFRKPTEAYHWLNCSITSNNHSATWVVSPDWNDVKFYVNGNGRKEARSTTPTLPTGYAKVAPVIRSVKAIQASFGRP